MSWFRPASTTEQNWPPMPPDRDEAERLQYRGFSVLDSATLETLNTFNPALDFWFLVSLQPTAVDHWMFGS
jgi:hypothetical protein